MRTPFCASVVVTIATITLALPTAASATHIDDPYAAKAFAVNMCNRKYDGPRFSAEDTRGDFNTPNGVIGWLVYATRTHPRFGRQFCAMTVRRYHRPRYTMVKIKRRPGRRWRTDASPTYRRFAGPVLRSLGRAEGIMIRGAIGRESESIWDRERL